MCGTLTNSPSLRELQLIESSMTKAGMVVAALNLLPRMETMTLGRPAIFAGNLIRKTTGSAPASLKKSAASTEMPAFQRGKLLTTSPPLRATTRIVETALMFSLRPLPGLLKKLGANNSGWEFYPNLWWMNSCSVSVELPWTLLQNHCV